MDSEDALAELGLEAPTSEEAIRRAYLRAVRRHPPERDPSAFQRVREAYDLLRDAPWLWTEAAAVASPSSIRIPVQTAAPTESEAATEEMRAVAPEARAVEEGLESAPFAIADDEPTPHLPWQDIEDTLKLIEDGNLAEARRLSQSLDQRMTELGILRHEIGGESIARFALVAELLALDGVVSETFVRALAKGVRSGDFEEADRVRRKGGWRLRRALSAKAPNLKKALVAAPEVMRFRPGFSRWSWIWVAWVVLQISRSCFGSFFQSDEPAHSAPAAAAANGATGSRAATSPAQQSLIEIARAIDEAMQYNDCSTVREHWPHYARGVREAGFAWSRNNYDSRRKHALAVCSELTGELTEVP